MFKKILLPVDFSENSLIAARHAAALACHEHAELTLLHVNELSIFHPLAGPLGFGISERDAALNQHMAGRRKELDAFALAELAGIPTKRIVCCGEPSKVIVERARAENTDLIMIPTRGHGPLRHFLLGSVTAKVLHDAECPVWTSTHDGIAQAPAPVHHVMCAVNFDPCSRAVIPWAARFAAEFGARLTVVHSVCHTPPELPERYRAAWHEEAFWRADERVHSLLRELGVQSEVLIVDSSEPAKSLAAAAREKGAGLLVIGRGSSTANSGRLGSHAYGIICQSPCPMISV